jgi:hypothetical protein
LFVVEQAAAVLWLAQHLAWLGAALLFLRAALPFSQTIDDGQTSSSSSSLAGGVASSRMPANVFSFINTEAADICLIVVVVVKKDVSRRIWDSLTKAAASE